MPQLTQTRAVSAGDTLLVEEAYSRPLPFCLPATRLVPLGLLVEEAGHEVQQKGFLPLAVAHSEVDEKVLD